MARYTEAVCRQCRREGIKLFLKGDRCYTEKCAMNNRAFAPGQHGQGRSKNSEYGQQLREKQKAKKFYGALESQFRSYFEMAERRPGQTGENLLSILESRLDNVVYRLGLAPSRRAARQYVLHGHITVNGRKAAVPSMVLSQGDVVAVKDKAKSRDFATKSLDAATKAQMPAWINLDRTAFKGEIVEIPTREQIAPIVDEQAIVELYSR